MIRFIDLFAGIGGFHLGVTKASRNYQCIYSNEWDKYANLIYKKHFGECDSRDITTVDAREIPDHDLLCGGFPCQSFSIAGKRRGFDDTRGTLFFDIARILAEKRPRLCLLENVKGLLSHDNGRTFKTILSTLTELGYDVQWQVLNSKNFGVPQNRERVFIIANLRGTPRPEVFPITGDNTEVSKELKYVGGIISKRDMWLKDGKQNSRNFSQGQRVYSTDGIGSNLAGNAGGLGGKTGLYAVAVDHGVVKEKTIANALDANYYKGIENHQARTGVMEGLTIRRLTPTECERLQGFPDGWTEGLSDTQRYKCLGNAVTVNVIEFLGEKLLKF